MRKLLGWGLVAVVLLAMVAGMLWLALPNRPELHASTTDSPEAALHTQRAVASAYLRQMARAKQEMDALEPVAALGTWRNTSFRQTFLDAREHLKEAGVPTPGMGAFIVAVQSSATVGPHLLRKRAEATRSQLLPGARYRLGHLQWKVGLRVSAASTILERMVGLHLMVAGAEDMQDLDERGRVARLRDEAVAQLEAMRRVDPEKWPLPSLAEELLEAAASDELAALRAFAGPLPEHASP
ncbi:hypothetical protein [Hyalangium gracile]|uniref:hypothetical protein n=1 Tax=Hyalangium gracile TaxID=394092 RepID=UPI001CCA1AC3|nr:hypothetical protein [Hyalangium gracile]